MIHTIRSRAFQTFDNEYSPWQENSITLIQEVEQSAWIRALNQMNYSTVVLAELPYDPGSLGDPELVVRIRSAESLLNKGLYDKCVAECRSILDLSARLGDGAFDWKDLASVDSRKSMTKRSREQALWKVARLYTDLANHLADAPGTSYSRREARMAFSFVLSFLGSDDEGETGPSSGDPPD